MYLVAEGEVLHRREHLAKRIENLSHGGYLSVEVPAVNIYGKGQRIDPRRIYLHENLSEVKLEHSAVEPEALYSPHKLQELWNGKSELLAEANLEPLKARGGDLTNNRF